MPFPALFPSDHTSHSSSNFSSALRKSPTAAISKSAAIDAPRTKKVRARWSTLRGPRDDSKAEREILTVLNQ